MSFRSTPLPPYEDIISGKFLLKKATVAVVNNENNQPSVNGGDFKYKTVNKISEVEDGEIPEEGEIVEEGEIKPKNVDKRPVSNKKDDYNSTRDNRKRPKDDNINTQQKKNRVNNQDKTAADFTSNITSQPQAQKSNVFVPRLICRYFMEGICTKADKCTFSHLAVPNKTPEEARVKEPCKFFIAGSCMKGEACYFSHDLSVVPCKFFHLKGECQAAAATRGGCRFSHAPIDKETFEKLKASESERLKEKAADKANANNKHITPSPDLTAKHEETHPRKETETSTEGPHYADLLLNPFGNEDDDF